MRYSLFSDFHNRQIQLGHDRHKHIEEDHPEMSGQIKRLRDTLANPDIIVRSRTDPDVELFYRHYDTTPVTEKFLCVVVKDLSDDVFIITAYFTNAVKRGEILWEKE